MNLDALVDAQAAALLLGLSPVTIRSWASRGLVTTVDVDWRGRRRYQVADLLECAEARRGKPYPGRRAKVGATLSGSRRVSEARSDP